MRTSGRSSSESFRLLKNPKVVQLIRRGCPDLKWDEHPGVFRFKDADARAGKRLDI